MSLRAFALLIVLITATLTFAADEATHPMLIRVDLITKNDMVTLAGLKLDVVYANQLTADVVAQAEDLVKIQSAGLHYQIVHQDLVQFYQSRFPVSTTMGGFRVFSEVLALMDSLHQQYPSIVSARDSVGYSWQGLALWTFKISDNVDVDEPEPEVFFNALTHAREPQGMEWQMNFARWLCQNYGTDSVATYLVDNREIFFMPVVNPDGYEYNRQNSPSGGGMYRKNRRAGDGVDLNRNFGYMWGFDDVGSSPNSYDETYRGPSAFSEPETQGVREFIDSRNFSLIVNAHTYGDYFLYPWGYANIQCPDVTLYRVIADTVLDILGTYTAGTPWELLYNTNGDVGDWEYGEVVEKPRIIGATLESGDQNDGFWPAPYRIPQINAQLLPAAKYLANLAGNPRAASPPNPPVMIAHDTVHTDSFTVNWTHNDSSNPAAAYELIEKTGYSRVTDSLERGATNWQTDDFLITTSTSHSPTHSLWSGDGDSYHGQCYMASPLIVQPGDSLIFYTSYSIEDGWDYAYVEVSTDGGTNFTTIPGNITTTSNPHGTNRGNGITGTQTSWRRARFALNQFVGSTIIIRFSYDTDGNTHNGGIYIDDIYPVPNFNQVLVVSSDINSTSYLLQGRPNGTYYYQVRAKDAENQWSGFSNMEKVVVAGQVSIDNEFAVPSDFALDQNYPNPFNAQTQISFSLASAGQVNLAIYDLGGRLVKSLVNGRMEAGNHQLIWDGKNGQGIQTATGVYFYKLATDNKAETKKMVLLR
jgi:hypothetical protein